MVKITCAYILAGGKSSKFGQDRLFGEYEGICPLKHGPAACREMFENVKVVARDKAGFNNAGCEFIF